MTTHALSRRSRPSEPRLVGLRARLHARALDGELAAGRASWGSPVHAARALQLTDRRRRARLATALDRLVAEASHPPTRSYRMAVAVAPCRAAVLGCTSQIAALAAILRDPAPVSAEGIARLRALLGDGSGPLYTPNRTGELQRALHQITRLIAVRS